MRNTTPVTTVLMLIAASVAGQNTPQVPASGASSQQHGITFRTEIEYVEVDAVVTDEQDRPVGDLTIDDFEVLEDGRPQRVDVFLPLHLPFAAARSTVEWSGAPPEPDVRSNGLSSTARLYVIVLDDLNTHASQTNRVRDAAKEFVERYLAGNDLAAIVFTSGAANTSEELTSGRRQLLAAVDKFVGKRLLSSTLERSQAYQSEKNRAAFSDTTVRTVADQLDPARAFHARQTFNALRNVGEYLMGVRGRRKSIVYFSEGIAYDFYNVAGENLSDASSGPRSNSSEVLGAAQDALAAVAKAGAAIYAINSRPSHAGGEFLDIKEVATEAQLNIGPSTLQSELKLAEDSLRTLAAESGGFAVANNADYRDAFDRIVQENSVYYLLGYYPTSTRRVGRFYKTEIKMKRQGLQVRARRGYMLPKPKAVNDQRTARAGNSTSQELRQALDSPVPLDGLGLSVSAVAFSGSGSQSSVAAILQIHPAGLVFTERDGRFSNALEISYLAIDTSGRTRAAQRDSVTLNLRSETRDEAMRAGLRVISRISLSPGRYQLRIGARERNGGRLGTVTYDLDVPDFAKPALALSRPVIASQRTAQIPTPRPDPTFEQQLPAQPTTIRAFGADDILAVGTHVYLNGPAAQHPVDIVTTLTSPGGVAVFRGQETFQPQERLKSSLRVTQVPLKNLAAGTYVIRVAAKVRTGTDAPIEHVLPIRIQSSGG